MMLRIMRVMWICLVTLPAICEPAKYQVATITDVKPHQPGDTESSDVAKYDVSVKVADTVYLVLYTDTIGANTIKYAAGRELLVHIGKTSITYNDILGRSNEVPIISQKPSPTNSQSK